MMLARVFNEITGGLFEVSGSNRTLQRKIETLKNENPSSLYVGDERARLAIDALKHYLEVEDARRGVIEDKAKINVLGVTLAFGVMFAGLATLTPNSEGSGCESDLLGLLLIPLMSGVLYLLMGGWVALRALRVGRVFLWDLEDDAEIQTDELKAAKILLCIDLNRNIMIQKSNRVEASYRCIRNGILVLAVVVMVIGVVAIS